MPSRPKWSHSTDSNYSKNAKGNLLNIYSLKFWFSNTLGFFNWMQSFSFCWSVSSSISLQILAWPETSMRPITIAKVVKVCSLSAGCHPSLWRTAFSPPTQTSGKQAHANTHGVLVLHTVLQKISFGFCNERQTYQPSHPFLLFSSVQVIWGCFVGNSHSGRAALPGSVQRASPSLCNGGRTAGETTELSRHAVRHHTHTTLHNCLLCSHILVSLFTMFPFTLPSNYKWLPATPTMQQCRLWPVRFLNGSAHCSLFYIVRFCVLWRVCL